ncbi:MAG: cytochrome-c peroxidase [Rhodospirillales bacterium]
MKTGKTISSILVGLVAGVAPFGLPAGAQADTNPPLAALGPPPVPPDNPQTPEKIELGKLLFFDTRLSGDASVGCATCHEPDQGWGFSNDISRGYPGTIHWRNSQTVINAAYYNKLFWAGAAKSLEAQAPSAAKGAVAGNGESDMMEARLAFIPEYRERFKKVFGDAWPKLSNAWKAIAAFERTLVQTDTPFDNYMRGDKGALSDQQKRGLKLFTGKANCIECHNGPLLSDQKFYNLGVPPAERWENNGLAQVTFRYEQYAKGVPEDMYRAIKDDAGLYYRTKREEDKGKFRTPSLRYTLYTAPYMHNGAFFELQEVVEFYNEGGGKNEFAATKTKLLKPLDLSDEEVEDLIAFLESLSGAEIKMKTPKLPPYAPLPDVADAH